jgi:hypothetical protein
MTETPVRVSVTRKLINWNDVDDRSNPPNPPLLKGARGDYRFSLFLGDEPVI